MGKFKNTVITFLLLILVCCIPISVFAISPSSNVIFDGIDVSNWQGFIDYADVKSAGFSVVYIKSSQGSNITDPYFRTNYNNAKANGLKVGFYHYLTARNVEEAENEAEYFASVISGTSPDCKLAMDFESFGDLSKEEINSISTAFLEKLKALTNKEVIIYSDAFNARDVFGTGLANSYPLWIAEYDVASPSNDVNWTNWQGFQYTDMGIVNGIRGFVDKDKFTENIFLASTSPVNTEENKTNNIELYTVKRGNTLSELALRFGTTVSEIAGLNGIRNPNLIFTGEVLKIDTTRPLEEITNTSYDANHIIYTVKRGNTLTYIANMFGVTIQSIARLNNIKNVNLIFTGERLRINN